MQKISKKEKEETKNNLVVYEYNALYVHKESIIYTMYQPKEEIGSNHFSPYLIDYVFNYNTSIFHPPIA